MSQNDAVICLKEISRVLKPDGTAIFSTPNRRMSQDHYHSNPENKQDLMLSPLLRNEYTYEQLHAVLSPLLSEGCSFNRLEIGSLANLAFRPIWQEALHVISHKRFETGFLSKLRSLLMRRLLPTPLLGRYFFHLICEICERLNVTLEDIVGNARYYDDAEQGEADHFVVIMKKSK